MFKVNDYVVYRRNVCLVKEIYHNKLSDADYYTLIPIDDDSLKIDIPVDNRIKNLRPLISKEEVDKLIDESPKIPLIKNSNKLLESEYKRLLNTFDHKDLISIIKTTYLRNKERLDSNKKTSDRDNNYFNEAERCLYNEFSIALGLSFDEAKEYVINKLRGKDNG